MTSIRISTRQVSNVIIVDIFGQLRLGEGTSKLRDTVLELLAENRKYILLNLGEVLHIDSSGIGELMATYTTVRNRGGELKLLNLNKHVRNLLQITRLYTIFEVHDDLDAAVQAFPAQQRPASA